MHKNRPMPVLHHTLNTDTMWCKQNVQTFLMPLCKHQEKVILQLGKTLLLCYSDVSDVRITSTFHHMPTPII